MMANPTNCEDLGPVPVELFHPDAPDTPPEAIAPSPSQTIMVANDGQWTELLQYTGDPPHLARTTANLALVLAHDDAWRGCLAHNAFAMTVSWQRRPPWPDAFPRPSVGDPLDIDTEYAPVAHWFGFVHGLKSLPKTTVQDAMLLAAKAQSHHPVMAYLESLQWDGTTRLGDWLSRYLGAPILTDDDRVYLSTYGRLWLTSAVARVMQPGCQADLTLVLEGAQGIRKTSALRALCPDPAWFLPRLPDLRSKDAQQAVLGKWIVEIAELDAIKGATATLVKDYLTQVYDDFRPPYGRTFVHHPRTCAFAASTNESHWNPDPSGGRRFIPVPCGTIDLEGLILARDQLWAEAVADYQEGKPWWCTEGATEAIARTEQESRYQGDSLEDRIGAWANMQLAPFAVSDVLADCLMVKPDKWDKSLQTRVGTCLTRLGYSSHGKTRPRLYRKAD
jgi:putative DNA primase/helicase